MLWDKTNTTVFDNQDEKQLNKLNMLAARAASEENNPKNVSVYQS